MRDIHPELRADAWLDRWVGTLLLGLAGVGILAASGIGVARGTVPTPLAVLFVGIAALFGWAAWSSWRTTRNYRRMTWVLEHVAPVEAVAEFLRGEPDTVQLTPRESSTLAAVRFWSMPCALPGWVLELGAAPVVKAHIDPQRDGPIVIVTAKGIIWPLIGSPCRTVGAEPASPAAT